MEPHYYVFRVGGSNPRLKHRTIKSAYDEALRLAAQHPGDCFEILECIGVTRTFAPETLWKNGITPQEVLNE